MNKGIFLILAVLTVASSCQYLRPSDKIIARVGTKFLYSKDVLPLIPRGISAEDSAAMVQQYIDSWALARLLDSKAREQLSKEEKDISSEVEEYSRSLLNFRFEKSYVESRLDTTISLSEMQSYYDSHTQSFVYPYSIFKVRAITISTHSPYYETVKKNYRTTDFEKLEELEEISRSYAEKYETYGGAWVSAATIAKDYFLDADLCESALSRDLYYVKDTPDGEKTYFIFAEERIASGVLSPIEYNEKKIKDAILSKRKQDIIKSLEDGLLNEAYQNNKLKIYINE